MAAGVRETDSGYKRKAKQTVKEGECQNFNLEQEKRGVLFVQEKRERGVNDRVRLKKGNEERKEMEWEKERGGGKGKMEGTEEERARFKEEGNRKTTFN